MLRDEWFNASDLQQSADDLSDLLKDIGTDLFRPLSQVELDSVIPGSYVPHLLTPDSSPIREPDDEMPLDRPNGLAEKGYPSSAVSSTVLTPVGSPDSSRGERSDSPNQPHQQVPQTVASTSRCNDAQVQQPEATNTDGASAIDTSPNRPLAVTRATIYTQKLMKAVYRHLTEVASFSAEVGTSEGRNNVRPPPIQCPIIHTSGHPSGSNLRNSFVQSSTQPPPQSTVHRSSRIGQQMISGAFYPNQPQGCFLQPSYGIPQEYYSMQVPTVPIPFGLIQQPTFPIVQNASGYLQGNRPMYSALPQASGHRVASNAGQHMLPHHQVIPIISMSRDQLPEARPPSMPNLIIPEQDEESQELPALEMCTNTPDSFQPAPGMSCAEYLSTLRLSPDGSEPEDPTPDYYILVQEPQSNFNAQQFQLEPNQNAEIAQLPQGSPDGAEMVPPPLISPEQTPTINEEYLQVQNNYTFPSMNPTAAYPVKEIYRVETPESSDAASRGSSTAGTLKKKPRKVNINYGTDFACHLCGKQFGKRGSFRQHWKQKHDAPRPFRCERCGKTFLTERDLVVHAENHDPDHKPWQCSECSNRYRYMKDRDRHYDSHHGEPAFRCDHVGCGKAFARRDHLLAHGESHLNRAMREQRKAAAKEQAVKKKRGRKPKGE